MRVFSVTLLVAAGLKLRARDVTIGGKYSPMQLIKEAHDAKRTESKASMKKLCGEEKTPDNHSVDAIDDDLCSWHALEWRTLKVKVDNIVETTELNACKKLKDELHALAKTADGKPKFTFTELDGEALKDGHCSEEIRRTAEGLLKWAKDTLKTCAALEIEAVDCDKTEIDAKNAARTKLKELCKKEEIADHDCTGPKLAAKVAGKEEEALEKAACKEHGLSEKQCTTSNTANLSKADRDRESTLQENEAEAATETTAAEVTATAAPLCTASAAKEKGCKASAWAVQCLGAVAVVLAWN